MAGKTVSVKASAKNTANPSTAHRYDTTDPFDFSGHRREEAEEKERAEAEEKERLERERRERSISAVNSLFGVGNASDAAANKAARDALYTETADSTFNFHNDKVNRDLADSERKLRFALARLGLFGSSTDVDQHNVQRQAHDEMKLKARNLADQVKTDVRGQDESARLNALNQINAGLGEEATLAAARSEMQNNLSRSAENARGQALSNAFENAGLLYTTQQQQRGVEEARRKNPYGGAAFFGAPGTSGTVRN